MSPFCPAVVNATFAAFEHADLLRHREPLSVRYFTLQPEYIHERIKLLGKGHRLRVLLVQVDVKVSRFKIMSSLKNTFCRIPNTRCRS